MLNQVVATLCMVESPVAAITVSQAEAHDAPEKEGLLETGPTITLVQQKPITSSIRLTLKHLVANAGSLARFRGFRIHVLYTIGLGIMTNIFDGIIPDVPGRAIPIAALAGALCANLHATWAHKVVSMPSEKTFWQRMPARVQWNVLCVPAAIEASMPYVSFYLTCGLAMLMGLHKLDQEPLDQYTGAQWASVAARFIAICVFAVLCTLFLCLPAIVTLVRVEASILPEEEDTIVPFDRTFGGKVVSKLLGGTGAVKFLDAWRSFNWEARRRLIKVYIKTFVITIGMVLFFAHLLTFEVFAAMGSDLGRYLAQMRDRGFNNM